MFGRSNPRKLAVTVLAALTVVFLILSGSLAPIGDPLARGLLRLAAPIHAAGSAVGRTFGSIFPSNCDVPADDDQQRLIEELRLENSKLQAAATENSQLKSLLSLREQMTDDAVAARVVYESGEEGAHRLILDKGAADGLAVGQPVVAGSGVIVGKISAVRQLTSTVSPLMDSASRLAVTVQNSQETLGVLEGDRGLSMTINLIPQGESLSPGETVITSGLEAGIRRGLVVGSVARVDHSTQEPFQSAAITPFISALHPIYVQVLRAGYEN